MGKEQYPSHWLLGLLNPQWGRNNTSAIGLKVFLTLKGKEQYLSHWLEGLLNPEREGTQ
jgi:hypothetical protein